MVLWRGEGPYDLLRRGRENGPIRCYLPQRQCDHARVPFAQHERVSVDRGVNRGAGHRVSG